MEILLLAIKNIDLLPEGLLETLYMTLVSAVFAYAVGLPLGVVLAVTGKNGMTRRFSRSPSAPPSLISKSARTA